ncbi:MAG: NADH-quinone oxidoreductase subunit NuoN [Alphaproteobacteria bacterium]
MDNWTFDLGPLMPEIFMAVSAMVLLLAGAFMGRKSTQKINLLAIVVTAVTILLVGNVSDGGAVTTTAHGLLTVDWLSTISRILVLLAVSVSIVLMVGFTQDEAIDRPEIPVLMVLASLGMMLMVSANNLLSLYIGLELMPLSLYVLAAIRRDRERASEAGMKYFVLGALASGILLYGVSMIYGFTGSMDYATIGAYLAGGGEVSVGLVFGIVFLLAGLGFKVSAAPFHMWTPDVYEGAPTAVTAFFSAAPKVAAMVALIRVLMGPLAEAIDQWQQIIVLLSGLSMVVGALGAMMQVNIKRMLAYSSIGHMGFALMGVAGGDVTSVQAVVMYMALYVFMSLGTFGVVLSMRRDGVAVEKISDLSGLSRNRPGLAFAMAVLMFSMAGIPPLAGFFAKLAVFKAAVSAGLIGLAVVGAVASVVAAFYYLRIIKIMYFDEAAEPFDKDVAPQYEVVTVLSVIVTVGFIFAPLFLGDMLSSASMVVATASGG